MYNSKSHVKGFTLIEMLVAMAIFSALITVLMMGFRQGLTLWDKSQYQSKEWLNNEFRYRLLDTLFSQAVVSDDECAQKVYAPYFSGGKYFMEFTSAAALMDVPGRIRKVKLKANLQTTGTWTLSYQEGNHSWVTLLRNLQQLEFSFEAPARPLSGVDVSLWSEDDKALYRDKAEWLLNYNACKLRLYPQKVLVSFVDADGETHDWFLSPPQQSDAWSMEVYSIDG